MAKAEQQHAEIVAQQELADSAKFTSEPHPYNAEEVVVAACVNGHPAPLQPCRVTLELSTDGEAWISGGGKPFGPIEGQTYLAAIPLHEVAASGAWRFWRLTFGGNIGAAVTIAANTGEAPTITPPEPPPAEGAAARKGKEHEAPAHKHEEHKAHDKR